MKVLRMIIVLACLATVVGCQVPLAQPDPARKFANMSRRQLVDQMFQSKDADMRRGAIVEIASHDWGRQHPYPMGFARLAKTDPEPVVRRAAITALGQAGDAKYINEVVGCLKDSNSGVRWDAAVALDNIIGPAAIEPLFTAALSDPEVDVRSGAAFALRHYRERAVLNALVRCLKDSDYAVRFKASAALTELTGEYGGTDADTWQQLIDKKPQPFVKESQQRPWWDWFGTAQKKPAAAPARKTAATPAGVAGTPGVGSAAGAGSAAAGQASAAGPAAVRTGPPAATPSASGGTEAKDKRPWWDWFGATQKNDGSAGQMGSSGAAGSPGAAGSVGGTTSPDAAGSSASSGSTPSAATTAPAGGVSATPTPAPAPTPSAEPPPEPRMGKPDIAKPPAATRPWWDWMGVTEKKP